MPPVATQRLQTSRARLVSFCCTLGPRDRPYPERHVDYAVALVQRGTFAYRAHDARRAVDLRAGWLLVGREGHEFECHHPHGGGDDCLSLHVAGSLVEDVRASLRLQGPALLPASVLPPVARVSGELALAARGGAIDLDATALAVISAVLGACGAEVPSTRAPSRADRDRVREAIDAMERAPDQPWPLGELAALVGASPFHFARAFRAVAGTSPHQYLVAARLRLATRLLLDTQRSVTDIALAAGFNDLSNFQHSFRRALGSTPRSFRNRTRSRSR